MRIIEHHTVELTEAEYFANSEFNRLLNQGFSCSTSAARVQETHLGLDPAFYRWLLGKPLMPEPDWGIAFNNGETRDRLRRLAR